MRILYKYFPLTKQFHLERISKALDGWIFFSSPKQFNDPFELQPSIQVDREIGVRNAMNQLGIYDRISRKYRRKIARSASKKVPRRISYQIPDEWIESLGVLCLSEINNDILMWSHYASCHTGVCIGFDSEYRPFSSALKVKYSKIRPKINGSEIGSESDALAEKVLLHKAEHWKYEQEWRCIKRPIRLDEKNYYAQLSKQDNSLFEAVAELLSNQGGHGEYQFDAASIRTIHFGVGIDEHYKSAILKKVHQSGRAVSLYQLNLHAENFSLVEEKIRD